MGYGSYWLDKGFFTRFQSFLVIKWLNWNFNLKILFSKKFSEWLFLIISYAKLKLYANNVSFVFWFGPYFGQKMLFLSFFAVFTWNQRAQYSVHRYINDRHDPTNVLEQENFFNFFKKNFFIICVVFSNTLQMTYLKISSSEGYWKILCV